MVIIDFLSAFGAVAGLPWLIEVTEACAGYVISRLQVARCRSAFWWGGWHRLPNMWGPCDERRHRLPRSLRELHGRQNGPLRFRRADHALRTYRRRR